MWRRRPAAPLAMAELVETTSGNVRIGTPTDRALAAALPTQAVPCDDTAAEATGWSIRDGEGRIVVTSLPSRAAALREIGLVAMRGGCAPYVLLDPSGRPTGDRLS